MKDILQEIRDWLGNSCRNAHEREEIARAIATLIVFVGAVVVAGIVITILLTSINW
jgi:hypothetical protein